MCWEERSVLLYAARGLLPSYLSRAKKGFQRKERRLRTAVRTTLAVWRTLQCSSILRLPGCRSTPTSVLLSHLPTLCHSCENIATQSDAFSVGWQRFIVGNSQRVTSTRAHCTFQQPTELDCPRRLGCQREERAPHLPAANSTVPDFSFSVST